MSEMPWYASGAITNLLYLFLLAAAILTLIANWRSAGASSKSADAAHESAGAAKRLYELQQQESMRREEALRPNLQIFDAFSEPGPVSVGGPSEWEMPLKVSLMNFGGRPAKITSGTCQFLGVEKDVGFRTSSCVRKNEVAYVEIDVGNLDFKNALEGYVNSGAADWYTKEVVLTVVYSETDGTDERIARFGIPFPQTRWNTTNEPVTLRVFRDGKGLDIGDRVRQ